MPTTTPDTEQEPLTVEECFRLFTDRRCRYGSAAEWLTIRQLQRSDLTQWLVRHGRINDGEQRRWTD